MTQEDNLYEWVQIDIPYGRHKDNPLFMREGLKNTTPLAPLGFEYRVLHVLDGGELRKRLVLMQKEAKG